MSKNLSIQNPTKSGKGIALVYVVIGILIIVAVVGYLLFSGKLGGKIGRGFEVDVNTGTGQIAKAAEAATKVPDTNAFDETNPYGYKNPFR